MRQVAFMGIGVNMRMNAEQGQKGKRAEGLFFLLVDDNVGLLRVISAYLFKRHVRTDCAGGGLDGLKKYVENPEKYDAILLDVHMPDLDGYETMRRMREHMRGVPRQTPIIAVSGESLENNGEGFDLLIRKPFRYEDLLPKVMSVLPY